MRTLTEFWQVLLGEQSLHLIPTSTRRQGFLLHYIMFGTLNVRKMQVFWGHGKHLSLPG